jgi:hypothetical protein
MDSDASKITKLQADIELYEKQSKDITIGDWDSYKSVKEYLEHPTFYKSALTLLWNYCVGPTEEKQFIYRNTCKKNRRR